MEIVSFLFDLTPLLSAGAFSAAMASGVLLLGKARTKSSTKVKAIEAPVENPVRTGWKHLKNSETHLSEFYINMEMDFALAFPRSDFSKSVKVTNLQQFSSSMDQLSPEITSYYQMEEAKKKAMREEELLRSIQTIQTRIDVELTAAVERRSRLTTYVVEREEQKEKSHAWYEEIEAMLGRRKELEERFDTVYLRELPQIFHKVRKATTKAIEVINENDGVYLNKKEDIIELNEAEEIIKGSREHLREYLHSLENFNETIMGATAGYRRILEKIDPVNAKEVQILEAAHVALYKAETHEYSQGNPEKEYDEILTPVYEAIALTNKYGDGVKNPKAA